METPQLCKNEDICDFIFESSSDRDLTRLQTIEERLAGNTSLQGKQILVNIPADFQERRLARTLENYLHQDLPTDVFEISVLVNSPTSEDILNSPAYVACQDFLTANPSFPLNFTFLEYQPLGRRIGRIRKDLATLTLLRASYADLDPRTTVMVFNDADAVYLDPNYLNRTQIPFIENPKLPALTGFVEYPYEDYYANHLLLALQRFEQMKEIYSRYKESNIIMRGGNSAIRMSSYIEAGGYTRERLGENRRMYRYFQSGEQGVQYNNKVKLVTSPRRQMTALERHVPFGFRYSNFGLQGDLSEDYLIGRHRLQIPELGTKVTNPEFGQMLEMELKNNYLKEILGAFSRSREHQDLDITSDLTHVEETIELIKEILDQDRNNHEILAAIQHKFRRVGFFVGIGIDFDEEGKLVLGDFSILRNNIIEGFSNY